MECIHYYLQNPKTFTWNMGFADFIRGTISIKQFSDKYNYEFRLCQNTHPLFSYLQQNTYLINSDHTDVMEFFAHECSYHYLDKSINKTFQRYKRNKQNIHISTHSLYRDINSKLGNWEELCVKDKQFIQEILQPSEIIKNNISYIYDKIYKIDRNYICLHIRAGDSSFDTKIESKISGYFVHKTLIHVNQILLDNPDKSVVLFCDNIEYSKLIIDKYPNIKHWFNIKVHTGNYNKNSIEDTITDYFLMSKADKIYNISVYHHGSGFSESVATIFDIPYIKLQ